VGHKGLMTFSVKGYYSLMTLFLKRFSLMTCTAWAFICFNIFRTSITVVLVHVLGLVWSDAQETLLCITSGRHGLASEFFLTEDYRHACWHQVIDIGKGKVVINCLSNSSPHFRHFAEHPIMLLLYYSYITTLYINYTYL